MAEICQHCKKLIAVRNPSGYCDHLYYPDNCPMCKKILGYVKRVVWIVTASEFGEHYGVQEVFDTEEKAKNFIENPPKDTSTFDFDILEKEVK